jgi:hypothetical protein
MEPDMEAVAVSGRLYELGATIASFSLHQLILTSLVKNGLLSKSEAADRLRALIAAHEQVSLPVNRVAAEMLRRMLGDVLELKASH